MRNLSLWNTSLKKLKISSEENFLICRGRDEDSSTSALYVCTHNLVIRNYEENGQIKWRKDLSPHSSPQNRPINITYLSLQNILCVGLENGELFTLSEAGNICDLTGVFESGLMVMEWSPDQELLALVTKDYNMVLLSCTFDPVCETSLLNQEFGDKQFTTVGWGKKETQFHGSEGKQAAKVADEISPDSEIDNIVKITWRGDGHLYAIGFTMDGIRRFKVFDREGHLQYTSEKQQGLEANISWRPSGNVIATTQKLPDKHVVAFFEKNGLKHREFTLNIGSSEFVENLSWNADSEILTLQCYDSATDVQKILMYTTANYHWYLKQTLIFDSEQRINKIMWDTDFDITHNKKLHVILQNGYHYCYTWVWNVDHSRGKSTDDDGVVAVIDGSKVLVTGLRQTVVPPPMCAFEVSHNVSINSVHFAPTKYNDQDINTNTFFILTSDDKLKFYEQIQKFPLQYKEQKVIQFPKQDFPFQFYNIHWVNYNTVICIMMDNSDIYTLVEFNLNDDEIKVINTVSLAYPVTRVQSHPNNNNDIFLQYNNGSIIHYTLGGLIQPQDVSFTLSCPKFNVIFIDNCVHFIGLTHKGHMYINDGTALTSVSSFFVHTDFLLVTTLHHVLLCVELTERGLCALKEYQKTESNENVYKRKVERGTKIVIAIPCDTRTVFQMPRGNLEAIQPRPLSLKIIGQLLDDLKYYEAFVLMRKQRINLNLIYDHNPEKFNKNIDTFLESIEDISWLNLFLSEIENIDVTESMYNNSYINRPQRTLKDIHSKIDNICHLVRDHLNKNSNSNKYILPLITTYVKKNNVEELEKALIIIKDLKAQELKGSKLGTGSDDALKYLLYMVDINRLFDVALGMYDFDLVLLVAIKSQKDPKEYIPMLNELNAMDENYKKFSINKHLKRFTKAVENLVNCGPSRHSELKTFVKYHSLYREALALFKPEDEIFKNISDDFGLYLRLKKNYTQAGIIYERANSIDKAIECYKDALEWELAIKLALSWKKEKFMELCGQLVSLLKEEKRHDEALTILEKFNEDHEETILYAVECGHFKTALRLCAQHQKENLKDEKLIPALIEEYQNIQELIVSNADLFIKHRNRLHIVRENKTKNPIEAYDYYANKDCDLYSDAGSTLASSSRGSSRSYRSSKNKRKHERKVASLKEGSQYEDVALVMALHSLVTSSFEMRAQVREMVIALSVCDRHKEALHLQVSLEKLLKEMKDSFRDIWTNELVLESTKAVISAQNVPDGCTVIPQGIASLEPHIRIAPVIQEMNWTLNGLE